MPRQTEPDPISNGRRPSAPRGLSPIDLPDDFGTDDMRRDLRAASWAAAALVLTVGIAALVIFGAFA